jgi:hypothetical protein
MSAGTCRRRCGFEAQHALRDVSIKSQPSGWLFVGAMACVAPTQSCLPGRYRQHVRAAACKSNFGRTKKRPVRGLGEVTRSLATEDFCTGIQAGVYSSYGPVSYLRLVSRSVLNNASVNERRTRAASSC